MTVILYGTLTLISMIFLDLKNLNRDINFTMESSEISILFLEVLVKLEDLKVLRRSPDLFDNVKMSRSNTAYNKTYFVLPYLGLQPFWSSDLKQSNEYSIKQPSDF